MKQNLLFGYCLMQMLQVLVHTIMQTPNTKDHHHTIYEVCVYEYMRVGLYD